MKNFFYVISAIILLVIVSNYMTNKNLIPKDAIRIRVIANSNSKEDQNLKYEVKDDLENYLYNKLDKVKNIDLADNIINDSLDDINLIVKKYTNDYKINYGMNYFPKKEYKSIS